LVEEGAMVYIGPFAVEIEDEIENVPVRYFTW
jgi:hypothetical protein